ncbi:hypothetical protein OV320_7944 [Actinobacteria bacterium OV320]|nr:hypothetical protein OV320_7944 [Actinobacteria bacterium OV320]
MSFRASAVDQSKTFLNAEPVGFSRVFPEID